MAILELGTGQCNEADVVVFLPWTLNHHIKDFAITADQSHSIPFLSTITTQIKTGTPAKAFHNVETPQRGCCEVSCGQAAKNSSRVNGGIPLHRRL